MKSGIKNILTTLLFGSMLYAGGAKNVVPQSADVVPIATSAPVSSKFYIGGGVGIDSVSSYLYGPDIAYSMVLRAGYDFMKYLGAEARMSYGIGYADQLSHVYSVGVYLKPQYPLNKDFTLYALAGYGQTEIEFENEFEFNGIANNVTTQNDFGFGIGIDYQFTSTLSLFADIIRYIDKETTKPEGKYASKVDSFTLGVSYEF